MTKRARSRRSSCMLKDHAPKLLVKLLDNLTTNSGSTIAPGARFGVRTARSSTHRPPPFRLHSILHSARPALTSTQVRTVATSAHSFPTIGLLISRHIFSQRRHSCTHLLIRASAANFSQASPQRLQAFAHARYITSESGPSFATTRAVALQISAQSWHIRSN